MLETGNSNTLLMKQRLTIRVGRNTLSFSLSVPDSNENPVAFEPYVVKSGVSMAANLREAFKTAELLMDAPPRARVVLDTPVLMVPVELFEEKKMTTLYRHAYPDTEPDVVLYNVLPDLNAVAVFSINKDLKLVVDDHFQDVRFICALAPVWRHLHQRSFTGVRYKLYGYFHEQQLEIFSYQQNRFKFCNSFSASRPQDALYFLLYVWKQLMLNQEQDEMHLVGDIPDQEHFMAELHKYLEKAYVINPSADFNRAHASQIKGIPYDLMTLFVKGR